MSRTDVPDITLSAGDPRPGAAVAPATHPVELARLAALERAVPGCDPLAVQAFQWLERACGAAQDAVGEQLRDLRLSASAFNALLALSTAPDRTLEPWQLAERLLLSRPSVTGVLDTLQARGLVVRTRHADDRRRVLVALTETGARLLAASVEAYHTRQRELFADLSPDDQTALVGLLRRVRGAVPADLGGDDPLQDR